MGKTLFLEAEEEMRIRYSELKNSPPEFFEEIGKKLRAEIMPKAGVNYKIYLKEEPKLKADEEEIAKTFSLCPQCVSLLKAVIFKRDNKVWIRKVCPEHGEIEELYWGEYELYRKFKEWQFDGKGLLNSHVPLLALCPYNCGLCPRHKSHPALINLVATNRCDISCWYCFFYAKKAGYVYEPTLNHIRYMLKRARMLRPYPAIALQITGGEPTLREDLVDIVRIAKEEGYTHVQVNTHGIALAFNPKLALELREAGTNVIYMSFDGVTPYTNPKNHWEVPYALENLRKAGLGVVLVPTLIKGYNDHEMGDIIRFASKNMDIIRGVNIQPVSLTGRIPRKEREKMRITIPEVIAEIERQTNGQISKHDWYPVPSVASISRFVEAITGKPQLTLTTHFACGAATYVFKEGDELIPITRFIDVEGLLRFLNEKAEEIEKGRNKYIVMLELLYKLRKFVDLSKAPKRLRRKGRLLKHLYKIFIRHDYSSLGEFHYDSLFLGMMHFMDLYNYDVSRVQRCDIHYVMPDGREVPFCSFNVIPEFYRDKVQRVFSYTLKEWEKLSGKSIMQQKYKRNIRKLITGKPYKRHYASIIDLDAIPYEDHVMASKKFGVPVVED
ncbi:MAG TPA: radical SAM protein [Thermofilum sp.]|nr:radical SAM protein [Thermofilum sp.]